MTPRFQIKTRLRPLAKFAALIAMSGFFTSLSYAEMGNPRVNQLGYLSAGEKIAVYKSASTSALSWQLTQNGTLVASGQTVPRGFDAASGDNLHEIDFSSASLTGSGFVLSVGSDTSYSFKLGKDVFKAPTYDALKYFYHNRSGIAIQTQYTGGGGTSFNNDSKWSRPAGHLNSGANKGDMNVPCWTGTCNYSLNVTKGWYDAGDHGKYVVNGGISVWILLNLYERKLFLNQDITSVADGTLNIPESGNGVADILDEARWEMEFLLSMQVPQGEAKAGMAHHKMHDVGWTGLPLAPHEDGQQRALVPPSTAATLNLAATAAQCARIWKDIDSGFSNTCLTAAERAWNAAQANPTDIYNGGYDNGGGGYGDKIVADEFYWAAAELYITTGNSKYLPTINNYSLTRTDFGWPDTELLGVMSLAVVPSAQTTALRAAAQSHIVNVATTHLATQASSGYKTPLSTLEYYWGSNSGVANKLMLMGLAADFTGENKFIEGVGKGLDYLLGRNALSTSFVTGEGTNTVKQPHHRFWAGALNSSYPWAPPGALSGGPNSGLEDSTSASRLSGCTTKPATCWVDSIDAWSTNEITINWNAPLAWALDFYNDFAQGNTGPGQSSSSASSVASSISSISSSSTPVSSSSKSSVASSSSSLAISSSSLSSSSSSAVAGAQCNWYGTLYPLCATASGWGWENSKSCIAVSTCSSQPSPYGVVGASSSNASSSASNTAPVASFTINGSVFYIMIQSVKVDASASTDADGDSLTYTWDWGNGQTATGVQASTSYGSLGEKTITLTVSDGRGGVSTAIKQITVLSDVFSSSSSSSSVQPPSSSSVSTSSSSFVSTSSSSAMSSSSSSILSSSSSSSVINISSSSSSASGNQGQCEYVISNSWGSGFTGLIRISNKGATAINGWNVQWNYTGDTRLTNSWGASVTGSNPYVASNFNWNSNIQPGQSIEIGFQAAKSSSSAMEMPVITGNVCN